MTITKSRLTEAEFMRLPDDGYKYELVDGEAKIVPTSFKHDVIIGNVHLALAPFARGRGYMTIGQAGFRMISSNIRCPDMSFYRRERFPDGRLPDGFGDAAPDLCIEVISPSEERADMDRKVREYFASGAQYVWHMFPETESIRVYTSPTDFITRNADEEIDLPDLLPGFRSRVSDLFTIE